MSIKSTIASLQAMCAKRPPPNEAATRNWIIVPLLKAAGYEDADILPEDSDGAGQRPDYTILPDDPQTFFIEAKRWGLDLQDNHATQATNYANTNGKRWVVLTNGKQWRLYDNHIPRITSEKLVAKANMDEPDALERFIQAIGKDSMSSDTLAAFAEGEVAAHVKRRKEQEEEDRAKRIRAKLDEVCPTLLLASDSDLIKAIYAVLSRHEELGELKPKDISDYFSHTEQTDPTTEGGDQDESPSSNYSKFGEIVRDVLKTRGGFTILWQTARSVWFVPTALFKILPHNADPEGWGFDPPISVCCWMKLPPKNRLEFSFECCRMRDKNLRLRFLKALDEAGFSFTSQALEPDASWTRFWLEDYRRRINVDPQKPAALRQLVESLLDERAEGFKRLESVCQKVFK